MYGSFTSSASASDCTLARNSSSSRRACSGDLLLQPLLVAAVLQHEPALLQRLRDARADLLEVERLGEVVHRARCARQLTATSTSATRGDHHDRGVRPAPRESSQQLEAVHLRHPQVAQHERHRVPLAAARAPPRRSPASRQVKPSSRIRCTSTWRRRGSSSTIRQYGELAARVRTDMIRGERDRRARRSSRRARRSTSPSAILPARLYPDEYRHDARI